MGKSMLYLESIKLCLIMLLSLYYVCNVFNLKQFLKSALIL